MSDTIKPPIIIAVHSVELWLLNDHSTLCVAADCLNVYKKPSRRQYYSQFPLYKHLFCVQYDTYRRCRTDIKCSHKRNRYNIYLIQRRSHKNPEKNCIATATLYFLTLFWCVITVKLLSYMTQLYGIYKSTQALTF